jgi:hypothetical protein
MTFNRLANIQFSRLKNKILIDPLQEPTIPIIATAFQPITEEDYLVLDQFLDTDLLNGEIAINTESDRVWVRADDSILELSVVGSVPSLTGGNGITIGASGSIDLGGQLTQATTLLGNGQTFDLGTTASQLSFLRINAIQSYEQYLYSGEGLTITQNPGTFLTDLDYSTSSGYRSFIQQSPAVISSVASLGLTESQITQSSTQINILTIANGNPGSGFAFNSAADSFIFTDNRLTPRGLEYQDDYSANFSVRSLIDKGYLDSVVSGLSFSLIDDTTPQLGGNLDLNNFNITGTGSIDIEGNVIADLFQLKGGVGTQGEMTWNTDEETIQLVMDGVTQHIGQDTYIHARNNTASTILKGTPVRATGTLGASGRITIAPMIANGSVESRFYIGIAAEDITAGTDGQVMSFGKIRQINLTNYNDGDVLWLNPTIAGGLTSSIPTAPNLKIATAFVIHAASNGTLFVRAEQGTDLHNDQRVQVSGLTDGDVLTWSNANQRWQNEVPTGGGGHEIYNGTYSVPLPQRAGLRFKGYLEAVDDAGNDESVVDLSSTAITPTEIFRFDENGSGNIDLKIAENKLLTGDVNGFATELSFSQEAILGLDVNNEVKEFEVVEIYNILREEGVTANKTLALIDINGTSANIKAKFEISAIAVQNTTANAVTINIGSASLGTDVANTVLVGANATLKLPLGTTFFSTTLGQNLFISSSSWNSASININITISKIWQ